jgi:hypothetical protein
LDTNAICLKVSNQEANGDKNISLKF